MCFSNEFILTVEKTIDNLNYLTTKLNKFYKHKRQICSFNPNAQ